MLKYLILSYFLLSMAFAQKISVDERRSRILAIVEEELAEVNRLARQEDYKSPDTLLRRSELNLEKARLWREIENEGYLAIPPEQRRSIKKKAYFKTSKKHFEAANSTAMDVVRKFPNYRGIGEVYYILGYNNKELGNLDQAKKYFSLSSQKAPSKSKVSYKSRLALADFLFNDHDYKAAIPLYESSLNQIDERWWTKDSFNLAWCYYRVKNYDRAISLMKEVHRKSGNNNYIDMRPMVERDIGIFFADAGKINEAIKFYEALNLNYTEQFLKVANAIMAQGRFAQAETLLNQAAKIEKDREGRIEILLVQLALFDKYNKIASHLSASRELVALHLKQPLNNDQYKTLSYQVNKKAAELQKATASTIYQNVPKVRKQKSSESIAYFELATSLNPDQKAEKTFFQGETAYAAKNYGSALGFYIEAFDVAKAANDRKIISQSLEGMLSSLGQPELDDRVANKFYLAVYSRYLSIDNKSNRANSIFLKQFNVQFGTGDIAGAESTMGLFAKSFPDDYKTQEGMLAKVMEYYRKKKDYQAVKTYVNKINAGEYKVSKKYADALRALMTKIQIEGVQKSLEKGDKDIALKGYHQIYDNAESTAKAKINAAYNLSALYYELGEPNESYSWAVKALKDMSANEVTKFADSFLSISAGLFLRQHFAQSADLSHRILAKLCKQNSSNKPVAYKNAVFISLANGDLDKAIEIKDLGRTCSVPDVTIAEVSLEIVKDLAKLKRWEAYEKILRELEANSRNYPLLIAPYEELKREFVRLGDMTQARAIENKQNQFFDQAKSQKLDVPVEALDLMADKMLIGVLNKKKRLDQIPLQFPEGVFNDAVKQKLQLLDQMATDVNAIQKLGSGKGIVEAYRLVIDAYETFGQSLKNFSPEGKSPEYVTSFQKAMSEVYNPILNNARKLRSDIKKLIVENKILSMANFSVLYQESEEHKRFISTKDTVLMERGGVR